MRLPMMARSSAAAFALVAATLFLGACADTSTSPNLPAAKPSSQIAISSFVPTAAQRALVGVVDGTYQVTFDPTQPESFSLGPNHLDIPANAICDLATSGYGASTWNTSCSPQTLPVTLTVVIKNSQSVNPSIQFFPAMRFSPDKQVKLFMYAPNVSTTDAKNWLMFYCNDAKVCVDESQTDASLITNIDYTNNVLFRRVKHFSGYVVAENSGDASNGEGAMTP